MPSSRPALASPTSGVAALALALCALTACKSKDEAPSTEALELIPAEMHAVYGRTAEDAPGMTVSASGLEFRSMKLTIHEGKMEGSTVQVERATLEWEKLDPKTCTGTIDRRGKNLLLSLFDANHPEAKCESILDAQWFNWVEVEALPEIMQGRYGVLLIEPRAMRLDVEWLHAELEVGKIWQLPGTNDERAELLIDMAKIRGESDEGEAEEYTCDGKLTLAEGRLSSDFWVPAAMVPAEGSEEAKDPLRVAELEHHRQQCDAWDGGATKNVVRLDELPKVPIRAGELSLSVSETGVVLDSPDLRCEQELWETETVDSRAGWAGARFGGERMSLGRAVPSRVSEDCKLKLRIWCEGQFGVDTSKIDVKAEPSVEVAGCLERAEHDLCPDALTVREISDTRYKVHAEPQHFVEIACVDTSAEFVVE